MLVDGYRCEACEDLFLDAGDPVWECSTDGVAVQEDRGCPVCHKFMAKVADGSCPSCQSGDITEIPIFQWEDGSLWEDEATARREMAPAKVTARERRMAEDKERAAAHLRQHMADRVRAMTARQELLREAYPMLQEFMPQLESSYLASSLEEDAPERYDTFLCATGISVDPDELLRLAGAAWRYEKALRAISEQDYRGSKPPSVDLALRVLGERHDAAGG